MGLYEVISEWNSSIHLFGAIIKEKNKSSNCYVMVKDRKVSAD